MAPIPRPRLPLATSQSQLKYISLLEILQQRLASALPLVAPSSVLPASRPPTPHTLPRKRLAGSIAMANSSEISPAPLHEANVVERKTSRTTSSSDTDAKVIDPEVQEQKEMANDEIEVEEARSKRHNLYKRYRPVILLLTAAVILGWWISATVLHATRHRWYFPLPPLSFCSSDISILRCEGLCRLSGLGSSSCECFFSI